MTYTFSEKGPAVSAAALATTEQLWGRTLPADYREFIELQNGGYVTPDTVAVPGADFRRADVALLFGIGRLSKTSNLDWRFELVQERLPDAVLYPFAADSGGNLYCFSPAAHGLEVVYCDLHDEEGTTYRIADGFTAFLNQLEPLDQA